MKDIETMRGELETSLTKLIKNIGKIQIGTTSQFPFGWGKAAKGRTVWRIVEEIIIQNIKKNHSILGLASVESPDSEVDMYDFTTKLTPTSEQIYVNIKSAVIGGKISKDDISKANGLIKFYEEDVDRDFFLASFFIKFNDDMSIEIQKCVVFPTAWVPDIYINPSNNGNLQSSKFKDISFATKRTNDDFLKLLKEELNVSNKKKLNK
jgi:hypothetical protein